MMQEKLFQENLSNVSMQGAFMSVASAALEKGVVTDSRPVNFTALLDVIQTRRQELRVSQESNDAIASALRSISGRAYMGGLSAVYAENRLNRGDEHWVTYTQNIIRSELGLSQENKITQDILFRYLDQRLEQEREQAFSSLDPGQIRETTTVQVSFKDKLRDALMTLFETRGRRRLVLASSVALTMTVLSPYIQTAIERINNIVSNRSTNVEASGAKLDVQPSNIMWNGAFNEPLSVEDSKANDATANAEVVLGPVFQPDNEIKAESKKADVPKALSLSPAQIEAASPPVSESEDIRKIGIARHAEEESNKFVENLKSEIVDRGGNTTEISEGVEQITFNRTMLPLYPQDNYWGKSINAAEMARMFNESMSKLGNLLPGYLYGLITDGIIDFNQPGFISASYRNKDGSVHTLIGAGACWGGTAMIQTMEHVNRQLIELDIPPMFLFVDKVSGETYPLNIPYKTNAPHPDGYMTYLDELTGYDHGYTFSQDDNSVLNVDIRFMYNPEFVEYMQSKGIDVEMDIELGFAFADEKFEGVGYPMIVESDTAFGQVILTLTKLEEKTKQDSGS